MTRRRWMRTGGLALGVGMAARLPGKAQRTGWFDVKSHQAVGDGRVLDTAAINRTIEECFRAGGGVVFLGPGTYLSGTVILKSNVTLYLEAGAVLVASRDLKDYPPITPGGSGVAPARHLILARDAANVGIAGNGRIDGQGQAFWKPVPPAAMQEDAARDVANYYWKQLDRPSPMVEFAGCTNVRVESVRIDNAPGWTLRTINCDSVFIHGVSMKAPMIAAGVVPTGCRNVVIADCVIDTGDDAICLKSENPYGDEVSPSRNITITNCVLSSFYDGLKIGSATRGVVEDVTFSNSVIYSQASDMKSRVLTGIAIEMVDGGSLSGIGISNIVMRNVRVPFLVRLGNRAARADGSAGSVRGVAIDGIHAAGAALPSIITGLPGYRVEDVTLANLRIETRERGSADWMDLIIPEEESVYPESLMFGRLPAYGIYTRHASGLRMRNLEFAAAPQESRAAVVCDDVDDLEISGLHPAASSYPRAVVQLRRTRDALIDGCTAPEGAKAFLEVAGQESGRISLLANRLGVVKPVSFVSGARENSVTVEGGVR